MKGRVRPYSKTSTTYIKQYNNLRPRQWTARQMNEHHNHSHSIHPTDFLRLREFAQSCLGERKQTENKERRNRRPRMKQRENTKKRREKKERKRGIYI